MKFVKTSNPYLEFRFLLQRAAFTLLANGTNQREGDTHWFQGDASLFFQPTYSSLLCFLLFSFLFETMALFVGRIPRSMSSVKLLDGAV